MTKLISNEDFQKKFSDVLENDFLQNKIVFISRDDRRNFFRKLKRDFPEKLKKHADSAYRYEHNCSLCDSLITDVRESHNASPLSNNRCCGTCNVLKVLDARLHRVKSADDRFYESLVKVPAKVIYKKVA